MLPGIMAVEMFAAAEAEAVAEEAVSDADADDCVGNHERRQTEGPVHDENATYRSGITNILSICTCTCGQGENDSILDGKHLGLSVEGELINEV